MSKYIVVSGSLSGLGKGTTCACLARSLKQLTDNTVQIIKIDPYLNVNASHMNPFEHGEVFVLEDGTETDLDLGTYERFLDIDLTYENSITSGQVFLDILNSERKGEYNGKTVQLVPHFTDKVLEKIFKIKSDVVIIELGGTVGDNESYIFTEALRQLRIKVGKENFCGIHISYLPILEEMKTKTTQHSVRKLREIGYEPDFIVCRCKKEMKNETKTKISNTCGISVNNVIDMHDQKDIFDVSQMLFNQNFPQNIIKYFRLPADFNLFTSIKPIININDNIDICIVGKYTNSCNAYLSLENSLIFAGWKNQVNVNIIWMDSENIDENKLHDVKAIIVPGGFGSGRISGKLRAIQIARQNKIPFLGICFGMQLAVIEYFKNVICIEGNSTEIEPDTKIPLFYSNQDLILGNKKIILEKDSSAYEYYKSEEINERHRHRYVFNNYYKNLLDGMKITGSSNFAEIIEIPGQWFMGVQFHPEFKSRPNKVHPLFDNLIFKAK